jgi:transcriptional regulator of arginine metabolism
MKKDRHARIIEIISGQDIETQEELADALRRSGYEVTQATVSRDIRDLRLTKVQTGRGHQKYAVMQSAGPDVHLSDRYVRVLKEGYVSMAQAQSILVIKTVPGMAMAVGAALDAMQFPEIMGCIAGDDTIFAAIQTAEETPAVMRKLESLIS